MQNFLYSHLFTFARVENLDLKQGFHERLCRGKPHSHWGQDVNIADVRTFMNSDGGDDNHPLSWLFADIQSCMIKKKSALTETRQKRARRKVSKEVGLPGKSWKYVSTQHSSDWAKLHSANKHFKSCSLVIWLTDLTKHEFRLYDVISVSLWSIYWSDHSEISCREVLGINRSQQVIELDTGQPQLALEVAVIRHSYWRRRWKTTSWVHQCM